jgi:DNA repair protein RAD16
LTFILRLFYFRTLQVKCAECGKRFYPDKMVVHKKYFCGEGAALTAAQAKTQRKGRTVKVRSEG